MAKKSKEDAPNPQNITNRDILQRMNFLYQASAYLDSIASTPRKPPVCTAPRYQPVHDTSVCTPICPECSGRRKHLTKTRKMRKKNERKAIAGRELSTADIAMSYVRTMKQVGQRSTVRMDPTVKRTLCKYCDTVLIAGVNAKVRVNPSANHGNAVTTTCNRCGGKRRIPAPPTLDDTAEPNVPAPSRTDGMEVDEAASQPGPSKPPRGKRRKAKPRPPPFFERTVGHVVFRGNEHLETI